MIFGQITIFSQNFFQQAVADTLGAAYFWCSFCGYTSKQTHLQTQLYILLFLLLFPGWGLMAQETSGQDIPATETLEKAKPKAKKWLDLHFSTPGGFYDEALQIELKSPGAVIHYTTDGSTPTPKSPIYDQPISVESTTVLRAVARKGKKRSKAIGHTYLINEPGTTFPTISLGITPDLLFDPEHGLYVKGVNGRDSTWKMEGANFWSRKEIKINTEYFATHGECEFNSVTGFRLFGGMSRLFPQKSITIVARDRYGKKRIKHRIFGKEGLKKFKFLVLRNSGSDWGRSHFRDALMTNLLQDWDLEVQDYRPAHLYLNGQYWGIYNIREKVNRYFIAGHHDVDKDSIDLIEHRLTRKRGSTRHYRRMLSFVEKNNLADPTNYAYLQSQMDVDNFLHYQIAQIYFDNRDAGGNIKFWRPQTPEGRWRWILYDTDWGFGLHSSKAYRYNSLAFHTEAEGPSWPNPPWSTFLLRSLLDNPEFQRQFISRFADHMNSTFAPDRVEGQINELYEQLLPEMDRHLSRWKLSEEDWLTHVNIMRTFARERVRYVRMHLMEMFNTGSLVELKAIANTGGHLKINELIQVETEQFSGQYFENIPVTIKAVPNFGYRFVGWEGIDLDDQTLEATIHLQKGQILDIKARFEPYTHPLAGVISINEISCNNKKSGDWIELYNYSNTAVSLDDWYFTDNKHYFKLPPAVIQPKDYIILCQDQLKFEKAYPQQQYNLVGNFEFGLDKRSEKLGLFSDDGAAIDSISYDLVPLDSTYTLSLLLPYLDNSDIENWEINFGLGSPNSANPYYLESRIAAEQEIWLRVGAGIGLLLICLLVLLFKKNKRRVAVVTTNISSTSGEQEEQSTPEV